MVTHTYANVQSVLDFGPVVKTLGITVKKEAGKVFETSGIVMYFSSKRQKNSIGSPSATYGVGVAVEVKV